MPLSVESEKDQSSAVYSPLVLAQTRTVNSVKYIQLD